MITAADFLDALDEVGCRTFTGVPCSYLVHVYDLVESDSRFRYIPAPNEGTAFSLAVGLELSGVACAVLAQNSGFGNLVNPLTSLAMPYRVPVLTFLTLRGWPIASVEEPQHAVLGRTLPALLGALGVPFELLPTDAAAWRTLLKSVYADRATGQCQFILIPQKIAASGPRWLGESGGDRPDRREVLNELVSLFPEALFVSTTGHISRDLFAVHDSPRHLYLQGSMGHASSVAAGVAIGHTERGIVVLDGDGSALMHLGALAMIGARPDLPLVHVILDNDGYESTGGQRGVSSTMDFAGAARACGYRHAVSVRGLDELRAAVTGPTPSLLHIPVRRAGAVPGGRATAAIAPDALARRFHRAATGREMP